MQKFTVFTIILSVIVLVVVAEVVVENYLPDDQVAQGQMELNLPSKIDFSKTIKTDVTAFDNKLGADVGEGVASADLTVADSPIDISEINADLNGDFQQELEGISNLDFLPLYDGVDSNLGAGSSEIQDFEADFTDLSEEKEVKAPIKRDIADFEDETFEVETPNVYLRDQQVVSAGFASGYVEELDYEGKLFKTIDTASLPDTEVKQFVIRTDEVMMAKVYAFKVGISAEVGDVYGMLKLEAGQGLGVAVNETNQFGSGSFYLNDSRRSNSAFLVVRIGKLIYGFSYPKKFHPQIKNLIQLLDWELG